VVKSVWSLSYSVVLESGLAQAIEPTGKCQVLFWGQKTGDWGGPGWSLIGAFMGKMREGRAGSVGLGSLNYSSML
jgi:hypothetical protein